jgi:dienelactone hydrolase
VRRALLVAVVLLAGCGGSDVRLVAGTAEAPAVRIEGLDDGETVELRAAWRSGDGALWTSARELRADGDGTATAGPEVVTGMEPPDGVEPYFSARPGRNRVELSVRSDGETVARGSLVREFAPVTRELTVADDGLAGLYFEPERPRGAAVVALGGSEGGYFAVVGFASALAAAGHPVLALAYFAEPGLPRTLTAVPVETVRRGVAWLRQTTNRRPVALLGTSRGGELALLAASLDRDLARTVVALVPSSRIGFGQGRRVAWTWKGRRLEPRAPIRVERIRARVLAVGAGQDTAWLSKAYVNEIERRGGSRVQAVQCEAAGHAIGMPLPYLPALPTNLTGGNPEADEEARRDLWPRILDALR